MKTSLKHLLILVLLAVALVGVGSSRASEHMEGTPECHPVHFDQSASIRSTPSDVARIPAAMKTRVICPFCGAPGTWTGETQWISGAGTYLTYSCPSGHTWLVRQ
jgi:hypothetical protein